jgi:PAS domain S-box-containing protein
VKELDEFQPYGDLSELNVRGDLLGAVGKETLERIARGYLDLLGTSAAIYETDGSYATALFSSGYCKFLDGSSRNLCNTADNAAALASGKWLCHESCWTDASRISIETGRPYDLKPCHGGIDIFAVPIMASGKVVGAINCGYGSPPSDDKTVGELAEKFKVDGEKLRAAASEYKERPEFVIEAVKRQVLLSAELIGEIYARSKLAAELSRKGAEDLQASRHELLNILESISDGFFTLNRQWRYTYLNTNAGRMVQRNSKDLIGKIIMDEFPEMVGTPYFQLYGHAMQTGEVRHFEEYYPPLDKWYEGVIYPYPDGISIYFQDVTERKRANDAMLELQQKLSSHLEQTMFAVIEWDREFKVRYWNPAAEKIFGYTREEAQTRRGPELIVPVSVRAQVDAVWDALLNQQGGSYSMNENVAKDGRTIICEWFNTPLADKNGGVTGVMSLVNDITDRKKMEVELNELNVNLKKRVDEEVEKNRRIDQLMFEQSRHIAMSELLVNIAHQWRQPLNAVAVVAQDVRDAYRHGELDTKYLDESIGALMSEVFSLSKTLEMFKDFQEKEKETVRFTAAEAVEKSLSLMGEYFKYKNVTLDIEMDRDVKIEGRPNEFSQAVLNILTNAKDVFEGRDIKDGIIKIRLFEGPEDGKAVLVIADNAGGIRPEIIDKVFDLYFTTKHKTRGTGLGLYMSRVIIEHNFKGSLRVRNADGWTEFTIEV